MQEALERLNSLASDAPATEVKDGIRCGRRPGVAAPEEAAAEEAAAEEAAPKVNFFVQLFSFEKNVGDIDKPREANRIQPGNLV